MIIHDLEDCTVNVRGDIIIGDLLITRSDDCELDYTSTIEINCMNCNEKKT